MGFGRSSGAAVERVTWQDRFRTVRYLTWVYRIGDFLLFMHLYLAESINFSGFKVLDCIEL